MVKGWVVVIYSFITIIRCYSNQAKRITSSIAIIKIVELVHHYYHIVQEDNIPVVLVAIVGFLLDSTVVRVTTSLVVPVALINSIQYHA